MKVQYPVEEIPATPEYILAVLIDSHRQQSQFDPEADRNTKLTFETTIDEWRDACDLIAWKALSHSLNKQFATNFTDEQWRKALEPARTKTLRGVCELIATEARQWRVRPARYFGSECLAAGVFLTIRSLLAEEGASVPNIKPSTSLAPYLRECPSVFIFGLARIAPGILPQVKIQTPFYNRAVAVFLGSLLLACFCDFAGAYLLTVLAVLLAGGGSAAIWYAAKRVRPARVEFGSLKTFADLSRLIASGIETTGRI
jgi:hypothetical protein